MKKITSIISIVVLLFLITSCAEKEKVDTSQAPEDIVNAIEESYQLSKELTDIQVKAGEDKILDAEEIDHIAQVFRHLAIVNNNNLKHYQKDKYFVALTKERKKDLNELAADVVFLKECQGYDELGLAIQKIAQEVKDVTQLPVETPVSAEPLWEEQNENTSDVVE
ncbi:MAG: hypothetical protein H8E61_11130 [Bacteroidetes bacterium]|nr:hypothetical protein [Bacteroidota bacterium]